jgi:hypothetical protein
VTGGSASYLRGESHVPTAQVRLTRPGIPGTPGPIASNGLPPGGRALEGRCLLTADAVIQWDQAVLAAVRNDKPTIGFLTRDLAIVHSAIYDAVVAIDHTPSPFLVTADASPVAAAAAAGLFTAAALFPTDTAIFQATYQAILAGVPDGPSRTDGIAVGRHVAEQTLIDRAAVACRAPVEVRPFH